MIPKRSFVGTAPLTNKENEKRTQGIIGALKFRNPKNDIMAEGFFRHQMYTSMNVKGGPKNVKRIIDAIV